MPSSQACRFLYAGLAHQRLRAPSPNAWQSRSCAESPTNAVCRDLVPRVASTVTVLTERGIAGVNSDECRFENGGRRAE
jgi:hypothetical protein